MPEENRGQNTKQELEPSSASQTETEQPEQKLKEEKLVKTFPIEKKGSTMKTAISVLFILIAGVMSGYFLSSSQGYSGSLKTTQEAAEEGLNVGDIFGIQDEKTFRDQSEGILVQGGMDGDGSHHLIRPGGESQNVYLTSSVVDLDLFTDHKVEIWGETFAAQKAGWLMDVGRIKVLELNAEKPTE